MAENPLTVGNTTVISFWSMMIVMDLKHKHWALIFLGILIAILAVIIAWNIFGTSRTEVSNVPTASTTPQAATSTAPASEAHITEHATYYDIDLAYPSSTPLASVSAEANANAVAVMRAAMQSTADQFKKDGNFANLTPKDVQMMRLDQQKESLGAQYKTYTGDHTVSYVFTIFEDTHGAHPNTFYQTFTFDTHTGTQLSLTDVLPSGSTLTTLSDIAKAQLPAIIASHEQVPAADVDMDYLATGSAPKPENYQDWYIDGAKLVIVFPPYQVGPYALGTVELPIPLSSL